MPGPRLDVVVDALGRASGSRRRCRAPAGPRRPCARRASARPALAQPGQVAHRGLGAGQHHQVGVGELAPARSRSAPARPARRPARRRRWRWRSAAAGPPRPAATSAPRGGAGRPEHAVRARRRASPRRRARAVRTSGSTPSVGRPVSARSMSSPGSSSAGSPRNLLIDEAGDPAPGPRRRAAASVPNSAANTPPRSMSPTTITGRSAARARPMLTMSVGPQVDLGRAAGALADHHVVACAAGRPGVARRRPEQRGLALPVVRARSTVADRPARARPPELRSLPGLSSTGLIATLGSSPHAPACIAWARPISPPSRGDDRVVATCSAP